MNGRFDPKKQNRGPGGSPIPGINWRLLFWLFIFFLLLAPWISKQYVSKGTQISYSAFRSQVETGNVAKVIVEGEKISGEFKKPIEEKAPDNKVVSYKEFHTYLPSFGDNKLLPMLEDQKVDIITEPRKDVSWWGGILVAVLPLLIFAGLGFLILRNFRSGGGQNIFSIGGSRARLYERRKERTTFKDVAGAHGAKVELLEIIEFLRSPQRFQRLGGKTPKGVLLVGPPGTGKTLLARAVAGEAEVTFFSITGSDFMEVFVGVGASRVRNMFTEAKKMSPSIIFIDELDSIGRQRDAGIGGGHDEREQTLNQLLSELDGFEPNENVIVMAATNRADILDPALLRPGRFDRRISVDLPSLMDRVEILKIHARNKPLAPDLNLEEVARGTPGFSGADLENLLNEAAILAARKNKQVIEPEDIDQATDKILMGLERENLFVTDEERKLLAYHEGGHAVVAAVLPNADPVHKVTIVPRGRAMGVTQQLPEREKYIYPREYMLDRLAVMMGGRAAEEEVMGTATSGAEDDLKQATRLARKMVVEWGMSERLGEMAVGEGHDTVFLGHDLAQRREYSESTARDIDEEVKKILRESYERAADVLRKYRGGLDRLAESLLEKEEVSGKDVLKLVGVDKVKKAIGQDLQSPPLPAPPT
ncbi:MAG: ATP-dependent zinc metalloprotease FtsH [Thermodesulfobacteriota bacterium]